MSAANLRESRRQRATPYTARVEALGVSGYSVVNHTILPKGFAKSMEDDYWHLKEHVQLWDVGCQRQVELQGLDAAHLTQLMTPRDLSKAEVGQCLYAPVVDDQGLMLNDPIILKLADDHFWLSIADSDLLLWAKGLAYGLNLDVAIGEPDVWPLAVQGPKSEDLMVEVFGDAVRDIRFFRFEKIDFHGHPLIISRSGYSKQDGFEIYLDQPALGVKLWDTLWDAGIARNVSPGYPNLIERVEAGLLSYGNEMTRANNPLECGLGRFCQLDGSIDFIGRKALQRIAQQGLKHLIRGVVFDGDPCPQCQSPWLLSADDKIIGEITTAAWSPGLEKNIALAMVDKGFWEPGTRLTVESSDGLSRNGVISKLPMID